MSRTTNNLGAHLSACAPARARAQHEPRARDGSAGAPGPALSTGAATSATHRQRQAMSRPARGGAGIWAQMLQWRHEVDNRRDFDGGFLFEATRQDFAHRFAVSRASFEPEGCHPRPYRCNKSATKADNSRLVVSMRVNCSSCARGRWCRSSMRRMDELIEGSAVTAHRRAPLPISRLYGFWGVSIPPFFDRTRAGRDGRRVTRPRP